MGKIQQIKDLLLTDAYTVEEIKEKTGASKNTILGNIKYSFKKQGYKLITLDKAGVLAYRIERVEEAK
jgi:hypothetical protein